MADEMSFELEDGEVAASGAIDLSAADVQLRAQLDEAVAVLRRRGQPADQSAADVQLRAQLDEAVAVLRRRGQPDLARLALGLVDADHRHAMWVLDDAVRGGGGDFSGDPALFETFRHMIYGSVLSLRDDGLDEHEISVAFLPLVLGAAHVVAARHVQTSAVPASAAAAAVRSLEKQTFRVAAGGKNDDDGITECSICFEDFVGGDQVSVMPCPSRVHKFHPDCIAKWLAISNVCPLCRYELPLPAYYE